MAKINSSFVCQDCGYESPKFMGKCPECGEWNSLKEFKVQTSKSKINISRTNTIIKPLKLNEIKSDINKRLLTGFSEMDNVLGGGMVLGSVTLLAGDPGIGKSTLLLQAALNISSQRLENISLENGSPKNKEQESKSVLYISGEESQEQIKLRALRLKSGQASLKAEDNLLLISLTDTNAICNLIADSKPDFVVIDSIQTVESENLTGLSGSIGQVRYATAEFIRVAKGLNIPVILVGHVTKEGMVAGPMILSHMVDTVLFLEGERNTGTRLLRSLKNRFGPVDEVGVFEMAGDGMRELKNPQDIFLTKGNNAPGSVLVANMEGTRAFLVEIQALCVYSKLPMPRRVASGIDYKRLELLLAVLQKHAHLPVDTMDVFVNVAGGIKLSDPACDLGVCLSVLSSIKNINLSKHVGIAEVGLLGELRNAPFLEKRIAQAKKLGITKIITSKNYKTIQEVVKSLGGK